VKIPLIMGTATVIQEHLAFAALITLWIIIIVFRLVGPVPINDQVKAWELAHLPEDWKAKRRRWDVQNAARVVLIGLAFIALVLSFRTLPLHGGDIRERNIFPLGEEGLQWRSMSYRT
jgi:Domain of unknown function (DUF1772)